MLMWDSGWRELGGLTLEEWGRALLASRSTTQDLTENNKPTTSQCAEKCKGFRVGGPYALCIAECLRTGNIPRTETGEPKTGFGISPEVRSQLAVIGNILSIIPILLLILILVLVIGVILR